MFDLGKENAAWYEKWAMFSSAGAWEGIGDVCGN